MAHRPFKLPDIGEGTAEAELIAWHVEVGASVVEDQPLCDVMTDKATVEVTAPFAGTILERNGKPGETLAIGSVILLFEVDKEGAGTGTDAVQPLPETGPTGTIATAAPETVEGSAKPEPRILASPALRKRAADLGVDLRNVLGSGTGGRLRQSDLDAYVAYNRGSTTKPAAVKPRPLAGADEEGVDEEGVDEVPVIGLRRRIAERMQDTKRRIPHFSYIEEVNVSELEALRAQLNAARREDRPKLTPLPFVIRALTRVLPEFPQLNALYDDAAGVVRRYSAIHIGIATQTPQGLVVPVLRNAGGYDIWGVAFELSRQSSRARAGQAPASDLSGSTITITSLGAMGGLATTPVINSPEVAIVGINKVIERPIVTEGRIEVAKMMNLSSSFDHRVVDGWDAASFVQRLKTLLETPALLFVDP